MYRVRHSYKADPKTPHTLTLNEGEVVYVVEKTNDAWWQASNSEGKLGYVPKDYIYKEQDDSTEVVLQSIERAIEDVYSKVHRSGMTNEQQSLLKKLKDHKENVLKKNRSSSTKRRAPKPPSEVREQILDKRKEKAPPPPPRKAELVESTNAQSSVTKTKHDNVSTSVTVPDGIAERLLENIKENCSMNNAQCRTVLENVLLNIGEEIPLLFQPMNGILNQLSVETIAQQDTGGNKEGDDLRLALTNIEEIKDDAQQRNWSIQNDEEDISKILNEIIILVASIERRTVCDILSHDDSRGIRMLVEFHQMESRVSLRLLTLQIFGAFATLSTKFVTAMLLTVLPQELARDIMDHIEDEQRVCYSCLVLSMLFSTAEQPPFTLYDPSENLIMKVIEKKSTCTALSENLMMLINRGDDPVMIPEHWDPETKDPNSTQPPHAVLKFFQDIFSQLSTANFLYTNDLKVLLEILVRNISDLQSGNKLRTDYLDLLLGILTHTNYEETRHKAKEFQVCLQRILTEEEPDDLEEKNNLEFDKIIVKKIFSNFGHLLS